MSEQPLVSAIVVAYRQREALGECLAALRHAQSALPSSELIVVDNGELASAVGEWRPDARIVQPHANLGFAGGAQLGIESARGRWIALVNDDAVLAPDALEAMVQAGESAPDVGAVAAQVRFQSDPSLINSAGIDVDALGIASERLAGRPAAGIGARREVFGASACVALYRAQMLAEIGGFEPCFFAYQEDVDLAWRARAAGWRTLLEPRALALHRGSASIGEGARLKYYLVGRNRVRLLARNATTRQLVRALPGILAYDLAYVLYVAFADRTLAPLHGRLASLREWRTLRRCAPGQRRAVSLAPASSGWRAALRQHLAYRAAAERARR
ncbi:MAG: glycosyltransferase family 2 protein [Solirubrobacteraceae bacterium]